MMLFLPVRDPQPAVGASWIDFFHLFPSSCGTHDSICGSFEHMERYQTPRLFPVAFQISCNQFQFFWVCFFPCPVGAFIDLVSLPSCASWYFQSLWIPCFRDTLYLVRPYSAVGQPPCCTYKKMEGNGKGADAQALARRWKKAAPLGMGLHACLEEELSSCVCTSSPLRMVPCSSQHMHQCNISWGSCVGKARTCHNSGEREMQVSLQ